MNRTRASNQKVRVALCCWSLLGAGASLWAHEWGWFFANALVFQANA